MDTRTVGIKQTIEVINRMEADGVIGRYALHPIPLPPQECHRTVLTPSDTENAPARPRRKRQGILATIERDKVGVRSRGRGQGGHIVRMLLSDFLNEFRL